jgi:hypothetical protein
MEHWVCIGGYHDGKTGEQREWLKEPASLVFWGDGTEVSHEEDRKRYGLFSSNRPRVAKTNVK